MGPPRNEQVTFPPPPPGPLEDAADLQEARQDRETATDEVVVAELMAEHGAGPVRPPDKSP